MKIKIRYCNIKSFFKVVYSSNRNTSSTLCVKVINDRVFMNKESDYVNIIFRAKIVSFNKNFFSASLSLKDFSDVINKMNNNVLLLMFEEDKLLLKFFSNEHTLYYLESKYCDYPSLNIVRLSNIKKNQISKVLKKIIHSNSLTEENYIQGVILESFNIKREVFLRATVISFYKVIRVEISLENNILPIPYTIIPAESIFVINRAIVDYGNECIEVNFRKNDIVLYFCNIILIVKLINNILAKYGNMFDKKFTYSLLLYKHNFIKQLKNISFFTNDKYKVVELSASDNFLLINTNNKESIANSNSIILMENKIKSIATSVNSNYIIDLLKVIDDDIIRIELDNNKSPILIKGKNIIDTQGIIMPVKV